MCEQAFEIPEGEQSKEMKEGTPSRDREGPAKLKPEVAEGRRSEKGRVGGI